MEGGRGGEGGRGQCEGGRGQCVGGRRWEVGGERGGEGGWGQCELVVEGDGRQRTMESTGVRDGSDKTCTM